MPPGVPKPLYLIVTPIEFVSTFVIRPITLTLRLLMNMVVGHLLLVLFFAATQFFFFTADGGFKLFGAGTLVFGLAFTLFEVLIAILQAYIFALLTAVYIQLALAEEH
jgi:F-type H+-transporting ATPase subunit a